SYVQDESSEEEATYSYPVETRAGKKEKNGKEGKTKPDRPRYQQTPATKFNVSPMPADIVKDEDLHPLMKKGRRKLPAADVDPRARTTNMRLDADGQLTRCYVRGGQVYVSLLRPCSICQQSGLKPDDHFNFEHNLYHTDRDSAVSTAAVHTMRADYDHAYQSSSESSSGNESRD
ncbi:hypothetical protein BJ508DRAFT_316286, partial [Ascobolus immersus RN42]